MKPGAFHDMHECGNTGYQSTIIVDWELQERSMSFSQNWYVNRANAFHDDEIMMMMIMMMMMMMMMMMR